MVTLQTAENALKTVYLGTINDIINTKVNPLLTKIEQTSQDVVGKEIQTVASGFTSVFLSLCSICLCATESISLMRLS